MHIFNPFSSHWHGVDLFKDGRDQIIAKIISSVSWTTEKKLREIGPWTEWHDTCAELHCVQDADRLDAIDAFGTFCQTAVSFPGSCRSHALRSLQCRHESVNLSLESPHAYR
jgi:uncharacterized protein